METKFKLKSAVRDLFHKDMRTDVKDKATWKSRGIPDEILDEVPAVHIEYGHKINDVHTSLSGHDGRTNTSDFKFTIIVPESSFELYNRVNVYKLMDEMQKVVDKYFKQSVN